MAENSSTKNKIILTIALTAVIVICLVWRVLGSRNDARFDNFMKHTASELNKICPTQVDRDTWLDSASVLANKTFRYNYTLGFDKDSIEVEMFVISVRPLMLNNVKTNSDLQLFRENNVNFEYYFKDLNGDF